MKVEFVVTQEFLPVAEPMFDDIESTIFLLYSAGLTVDEIEHDLFDLFEYVESVEVDSALNFYISLGENEILA